MAAHTLRRVYDRLPEDLRTAIPSGTREFLRTRFLTGGLSPRVKYHDERLWGGFSRSALAGLAAIKADGSLPVRDRAEACHSLARWHAVHGDFAAALTAIGDRRALDRRIAGETRQYMLEALFLCNLGRGEEARALLLEHGGRHGLDTSFQLALANTWSPAATGTHALEAEEKLLEHVNAVYRRFGLRAIGKRDPQARLSLDNLCGTDAGSPVDADARVTVIVPAYNAAATIGTALRGLAEQSWRNLEVLVVDDASTDDTAQVAAAFCATDARFRLIRQPANVGAYRCRNRALEEASGAYVTIHDSDDWSHPDKIALQAGKLLGGTDRYNLSALVRCTADLMFAGPAKARANLILPNHSSALFRIDDVKRLGGWDEVRVSADTEFFRRFEAAYGDDGKTALDRIVLPDCPLSFARLAGTSLTRTADTHMLTLGHGTRREYREATEFLLKKGLKKTSFRQDDDPDSIASWLPATILPGRAVRREFDVLFIGDFNMKGGAYHSAMNMVLAARRAGLRCGVLHYRRYDLDVTSPLDETVREIAYRNGVTFVTPGETLSARDVIITYPAIIDHAMDRFPEIDHQRLVVVVNQMAERDVAGRHFAYDPARVRRHLVEFFGHEGDWVPISSRVRRIMEQDGRYPRPHADTWTPLLDIETWSAGGRSRWRGDERARPVIGRHGRDHVLKWPGSREALLAAYCADRPCDVRFLGGARNALKLTGRRPANWRVHAFGSQDVTQFLADLDFFVHYPHEDYIEEFGRAPMEAMASGVPVILPPVFRDTFADSALYAEPQDVWPTIARLWADKTAWTRQAEAGRAFVEANSSYAMMRNRLRL